MKTGRYILAAAAALLVLALPAAATATPVTLVLEGSHPYEFDRHQGSFTAPAPLCPSGSWQGNGQGQRVFSCADGSGTFMASFDGNQEHHTGGSGPWWITAGTDRYATLRGKGTASNVLISADPITFTNTWQGVVDFDAIGPAIAVLKASATRLKGAKPYVLRVAFSAPDNVAVWAGEFNQIARRGGTVRDGTVSLTLKIRVPAKAKSVKVQIEATDPVGNTRTIARKVKLRTRGTAGPGDGFGGQAQPLQPEQAACTPKHTTIGGHPAIVECGPAKATVRYGGKTFAFSGGACKRTSAPFPALAFTLYIGTKVTGAGSPHLFFAFGDIKRDGTYATGNLEVGFQDNGVAYDLHNGKTTVTGRLHKGTFSGGTVIFGKGKLGAKGKAISGSFTC
jgi:hypothetical protein